MKTLKLSLVLIIFLCVDLIAQFAVISTKIIPHDYSGYRNLFTSFTTPATSGVHTNFPSRGLGALAAQENIVDARVDNGGAVVEARASVSPLAAGDVLTNTVNFYTVFRDNNLALCQSRISIILLYEVINNGAVADLYYALNPQIQFIKNGRFAGGSGDYRITLNQSDASAGLGTSIYDSGTMTAGMNTPIRGTAFTNVSNNSHKYIRLEIWIYAASEVGIGTTFLVDGSQGLAIGFDDTAIPVDNDLNNNPGIDVDAKMKFQLHNLEATDASGPAMGGTGAFAYKNLDWNVNISDAYAIEENTVLLDGVDGITVTMDGFSLFDFRLLDITMGNQRDRRTYINGIARIYQNDVLKLELTDCRIGLNVHYPVPFGDGAETTGGGWGEINPVNSDDAWEAEFDAHGTGQVDFVFNSFSAVVNNPFYDAVISIVPTYVRQKVVGWDIQTGGGTFDYLAEYYVSFLFTSATKSIKNSDEITVSAGNGMVRLIEGNPGGANPIGIDAISPDRFWEFGTTVSDFSANITFDLTGVDGISNLNNIRILHRDDENSAWAILDPNSNTYHIVGNKITVDGINSFSQFGVGSTGGNPLPVELTSFTANISDEAVILNWQTATEVNNYGFEVERTSPRPSPLQGEGGEAGRGWETLGFVPGHGNSNSVKEYSFVDKPIGGTKYKYRLKQIDNNGSYEYSNEVEVDLEIPNEFSLAQNYPNPFNPGTVISWQLPVSSHVSLIVYDMLGNEVATLVNEEKTAGRYEVEFTLSAGNTQLSSGVYFYRLQAGSFVETKKMQLLK